MQTNVAVGLTSLKNQIQASGAERRKLVPRMHQKSPFGDPNSKKNSGEGAQPSAPSAHSSRTYISHDGKQSYGANERSLTCRR